MQARAVVSNEKASENVACPRISVSDKEGSAMKMLNRNYYPELDIILWDRAERLVDPKFAFRVYEERWRFVDQNRLNTREITLIEDLTHEYGHGQMLVA